MDFLQYAAIGLLCFIGFMICERVRIVRTKITPIKKPTLTIPTTLMSKPVIGIVGVTVKRNTVTVLLPCFKPVPVIFQNIIDGHTKDVVWITVKQNGDLKQFQSEAYAQQEFKKGDHGIIAVMMLHDRMMTRDILPNGLRESQINTIQLNFAIP